MKRIIASAVILFIATSCKTSKEAMNTPIPLYETKWSLKKIYNNHKEEIITTKAFLRFDKGKGSAGGNGSCNSFGSSATVKGNQVSFKNIFSTKMYCESVQQIENQFFNKLATANKFEIKKKKLILYNDKEKLLEFMAE